ncbi:MAG: hypothetical protein V4675_03675 [Verrucomicrobiota bacterium]
MKPLIIPAFVAFSFVMSANGQDSQTKTEKTTKTNPDGSTQQTTTTITTFNPETNTKVVEYFDAYKANPYGLPPEWTTRMKIKQIPPAWRTTQIPAGTIVTKEQQELLLEAPPALVKVLPAPKPEIRYYVAGGNVIAVDKSYKVVDSLRVPSVKFDVEVDDGEIEIKKKEKDD